VKGRFLLLVSIVLFLSSCETIRNYDNKIWRVSKVEISSEKFAGRTFEFHYSGAGQLIQVVDNQKVNDEDHINKREINYNDSKIDSVEFDMGNLQLLISNLNVNDSEIRYHESVVQKGAEISSRNVSKDTEEVDIREERSQIYGKEFSLRILSKIKNDIRNVEDVFIPFPGLKKSIDHGSNLKYRDAQNKVVGFIKARNIEDGIKYTVYNYNENKLIEDYSISIIYEYGESNYRAIVE